MISNVQLVEQLTLQHKLNSAVNPDWLKAGNAWTRAIMVEGVEALDHVGWKWWKKSTPNYTQAQIELIDIWHFYLSFVIENHEGDIHAAAAEIRQTSRNPSYTNVLGFSAENASVQMRLDDLVGVAAVGSFSLGIFTLLMDDVGLTWSGLHRTYMAKNVLNIFRLENGYKTGDYFKFWDGAEDNTILAELMEQTPDASVETLTAQLTAIYRTSELTKEPA